MTININYDKPFALKSLFVLGMLVLLVGSYKWGYKNGLRDMAKWIVAMQNDEANRPKINDDETLQGSSK